MMLKKHKYRFLITVLIGLQSNIIFACNTSFQNTHASDSISLLETVVLNGIPQKIRVTGYDSSKPLLLFVHGGPGFTEMAMVAKYNSALNNSFITVNWDQRGTGLSYSPSIPREAMTLENIISDGHQLINWLKKKYKRKKIFLVGHSFGTYIATMLAERYPQDFYAYVGIGQVTNMVENERVSLAYTVRMANQANNKLAIVELKPLLSRYPDKKASLPDLYLQRKWLAYFGGAVWNQHDYSNIYKDLGESNRAIYNAKQSQLGEEFSMNTLWNQLMKVNLNKTVPQLKVPVYFLLGRHDYNASFELGKQYLARLKAPKKKLIVFENSAHLPCFEESAKFIEVMRDIAAKNL